MQKLRFIFSMLVAVVVFLWKEQRDVVLIWGLFCIVAMVAGFIELSLALFCGGVAGVLLLLAFGYYLAFPGDDE